MGYTVIPSQFDTDNVTLEKNSVTQKYQVGEALQKTLFSSIAYNNLQITVLNVSSAITGATDDQSDIYTDSTGLLNTVEVGADTTSILVASTYQNLGTLDTNPWHPSSTSNLAQFGVKAKQNINILNLKFTCRNNTTTAIDIYKDGSSSILKTIPSATYTNGTVYTVPIGIELATGEEISLRSTSGVECLNYSNSDCSTNDYIEKPALSFGSGWSAKNLGEYNSNGDGWILADGTSSTKITHTYSKSKPKSIVLALFSADGSSADIGDATYFLSDGGSNQTDDLQPWELIPMDLSWTPTQLIIDQPDSSASTILKYVCLAEEDI